ncbi:MAG: DUF4258 domain-containing protein [Nanoarchaeota archaeon]|nr:DUF4258 domain-containing protein [Nanoarchaeota archaeon]
MHDTKRLKYIQVYPWIYRILQMKIVFSFHAVDKMDMYGIDRKEVEAAIAKGMKWKEEHSEKWHAQMAGIEAVFVCNEDAIFVITVYPAGD